jgi:iron complex transport system substrate-binding protein
MQDVEELAATAVDCGFHIHKDLGPGMLESGYEAILELALKERGLSVGRQVTIPIKYRGLTLTEAFRADLLVEGKLIIEIKSVERNSPIHSKQLLTYLRLLEQPVGLLMNFGCETFRDGLRRVVNRYTPFAPSRLRVNQISIEPN